MNRRGAALVAAIAALALVGSLAALALGVARQRVMAGRRQIATLQARSISQGALARHLASWDPHLADSLSVGEAVSLGGLLPVAYLRSRDSLVRLGPDLFQLRSLGERRSAGSELLARRRLALLLVPQLLGLPDTAAIFAGGPVTVGALAGVSGEDSAPDGWSADCPPPAGPEDGVLDEIAPLSMAAQTQLSQLIPLADLRTGGTLTPGPQLNGLGDCVPGPLNWGDPGVGPCRSLFEVIVLEAGSLVDGGIGQGLILGLGSVELSGDFCFAGVIVALGDITMRDEACVSGLVVGQGRVTLQDRAMVHRSICVVNRVRRLGRRLQPMGAGQFEVP